jgi:predicted DNA binding CopG/RHH family protein
MGNQENCLFRPLKKQKNAIKIALNDYFSDKNLSKSANNLINKSTMFQIKLSQGELDRITKKADEMGLPDSLDCLND